MSAPKSGAEVIPVGVGEGPECCSRRCSAGSHPRRRCPISVSVVSNPSRIARTTPEPRARHARARATEGNSSSTPSPLLPRARALSAHVMREPAKCRVSRRVPLKPASRTHAPAPHLSLKGKQDNKRRRRLAASFAWPRSCANFSARSRQTRPGRAHGRVPATDRLLTSALKGLRPKGCPAGRWRHHPLRGGGPRREVFIKVGPQVGEPSRGASRNTHRHMLHRGGFRRSSLKVDMPLLTGTTTANCGVNRLPCASTGVKSGEGRQEGKPARLEAQTVGKPDRRPTQPPRVVKPKTGEIADRGTRTTKLPKDGSQGLLLPMCPPKCDDQHRSKLSRWRAP